MVATVSPRHPSPEPDFSPDAMTRHYPGFLAAFFIILLRIVIGWHFLIEGSEKYDSTQHGKEAFSAEVYLRNANGPVAPYFRGLLPDVDGREALDLTKKSGRSTSTTWISSIRR
jgi:hypothetical protein